MSELSQFQALVAGAIAGGLAKAAEDFLVVDVEIGVDANGDYTNEIMVTGKNSGEKLLVKVERVDDE